MKTQTANFKTIALSVLFLLILAGLTSALTGSIGNGRMILRGETGDKIEKYVRVINSNNVDVNIEVFASGDLADYIEIKDKEFTLKAGEEKNAYFTIEFAKSGKTESSVNVKFSPIGEGNGVGLSSTIIVIAEGEDENENNLNLFGNNGEKETNVLTGSIINNVSSQISGKKNLLVILSTLTTLIFLILLVTLLSFQSRIKLKKSVQKQ